MKNLILTLSTLISVSAFAKSAEDIERLYACAPEAASTAVYRSNIKDVEHVELNIENDDFETKILENGTLQYDAYVYDSMTGNSEPVLVLLKEADCSPLND